MTKNLKLIRAVSLRVVFLTLFFIIVMALIGYARGYRLSFEDQNLAPKGITSTGIISVSAFPKGSKVYVNGSLKGVTDLNVTLPPGEYTVEVKKEGYTEWKKQIKLQGEIVITLDALLFPKNPSLLSLTNLGIVKAVPYHQADKIILFSENDDPEKDGVYVFDADQKPLSFYAPLKLLILKKNLPADVDFKTANVEFSPDFQQAIFEFPTSTSAYDYLFSLGEESTQPFDVSSSKQTLIDSWQTEKNKEVSKILETFPKALRPLAQSGFSIIGFSPDQKKVLYQAKSSFTLPLIKNPPLIGANQSHEVRTLQKGSLYVYDKTEDKNFALPFNEKNTPMISPTLFPSGTKFSVPTATPTPSPSLALSGTPTPNIADDVFPIMWNADSKHISIQQKSEIVMVDYDGDNARTIYSGPFEQGFFFITNSGKLYILTNLNPQYNKHGDLYEIGIQ